MANSEDRKDSVIMDEIDEKERSGQTEQSEQKKQAEQGDECADQTTEQTEKPAGQETPEGGLRIQLDAMRAMSLPLLTAGYPLIRQIVLENQGKAAVTGLRLRVVSPEGFFQPWERDLPAIPADTALPAEIPALVFDAQKMAELTEPAAGFIRAEVVSGGAGDKGNETIRAESASGDANVTGNGAARVKSVSGDTNGTGTGTIRSKSAFGGTGNAEAADEKVLCAAEAEVTYYPFQYWTGAGEYPELLASFLTPDRPALAGIVSRAGELLRTWTGDGTMDGYQSGDQDRVIRQASALYVAVRDHGIRYIHSAPGLGEVPQPVQFAEVTLQEHAGSCLDLVILFASLLEAIHLHPFILQSEGHLFAGLWLNETAFMPSVTVGSEKAARELNKGIGAAVMFETTLVTKAGTNFELARRTAEMEARDPARPVTVLYDISSIRADGIRPLPLRSVSVDEQPEEEAADRQAAERDAADGQRDEKPYADDRVVGSRGTERRDAGDWIPESNDAGSGLKKNGAAASRDAENRDTGSSAAGNKDEDSTGKNSERYSAGDDPAGNYDAGNRDPEETSAGEHAAARNGEKREKGGTETDLSAPVSETAVPERAYRWIRQLLALQADNPLIDQKQETILPILMPTADGLLAPLAGGKAFALYPGQEEWRTGQAADADEAMSDPGAGRSQVVAELTSCRVRTSLDGDELARAAAELTGERDAQLREHAENPLYLVLGRLRWFEPDKPDRPHEAPLILVPVDLQRQESGSLPCCGIRSACSRRATTRGRARQIPMRCARCSTKSAPRS